MDEQAAWLQSDLWKKWLTLHALGLPKETRLLRWPRQLQWSNLSFEINLRLDEAEDKEPARRKEAVEAAARGAAQFAQMLAFLVEENAARLSQHVEDDPSAVKWLPWLPIKGRQMVFRRDANVLDVAKGFNFDVPLAGQYAEQPAALGSVFLSQVTLQAVSGFAFYVKVDRFSLEDPAGCESSFGDCAPWPPSISWRSVSRKAVSGPGLRPTRRSWL